MNRGRLVPQQGENAAEKRAQELRALEEWKARNRNTRNRNTPAGKPKFSSDEAVRQVLAENPTLRIPTSPPMLKTPAAMAQKSKAGVAPKPVRAKRTTKAVFISAIGHTDHEPGSCGWWWCKADAKASWPEMQKVLDALREDGVAPCGPYVCSLGVQRDMDAGWSEDRQYYEALDRAIRAVNIPDDTTSSALLFKGAFLEELKPQLEGARIGVPPSHANRPKDVSLQRTVYLWREGFKIPSEEGGGKTKPLCGKPASLAAALVLLVSMERPAPFACSSALRILLDPQRNLRICESSRSFHTD